MSQSPPQQLERLLVLKERDGQQALRALHAVQAQFASLRQRHTQLQQYREEYVLQLNRLGEEGCQLAQMKNRLDFIAQLDHALHQLGHQLAQMAKQRQQAQQKLQAAKRAEESVKKLIERRLGEQQYQLGRQAQKENDEFAQKQWYNRTISANKNPDSD
ncbi:MAG: flagellar export protein FliJ [Legionellaceae bacterium]|nr:flagellar export protein FliJ [Legionellaceae bacterium]